MSQPQRFQTAVKWAFVMSWGPSAVASLLTFVLAMYLGPHDYGLVTMAAIYIAFNKIFLEGGLGAAIVQRKDLEPEHLDSVFWITLLFSFGLMLLMWLVSPLWAAANRVPELWVVMNVLACGLPLQGLTVVQESLLERQLDFKSLAIRSNISALLGGVFGFYLAVNRFGVWSLVGEELFASGIRLMLLWRLGSWRPRLAFSGRHLKELFGFSVYIMIGQIGSFVQRRSDALLIGLFFGPAAVGIYRLADRLISMVIEIATRPFVLVVLPNFSRLQDNITELRKSVKNCLAASAMLTMPLLAMLAGLAYLICATLSARGKDWRMADHVIQILALVGAARAVTLFAGPLVQSINRPRLFMTMSWGLAGLNTIGFCIAGWLLRDHQNVQTQAMGVAAMRAVVFCLIYTPICLWVMARICRLSVSEMMRTILPATITALAVFAFASVLDIFLRLIPAPAMWIKLGRLGLGFAATGLLAFCLMFKLEPRVRDIVLRRIEKFRGKKPPGQPQRDDQAAYPATVNTNGRRVVPLPPDGEVSSAFSER